MMEVELLREELLLVEVTVFIEVSLLYEFQNVIIADNDIQVLIENLFYLGESNKALLLSIEKAKHVEGFIFPAPAIEPLFLNHLEHFRQGE